jgi:hypothetical protein
MLSFSKTLSLLLSILSDVLHRNDSLGTFCNRIVQIETVHPRFYPILTECHRLLDNKQIFEKRNEIIDLCTCGEEDCDCTWDF